MKRTAKLFAAGCCALLGILSCRKEETPEFGILGGNEYPVENSGGYVTVIMHTNLAYTATPSADWCHVVVKQPICFKVQVDENAALEKREAYVTVETDGFDPIQVKIIQNAGQLFFRMEESEKSRIFSSDGGTQTIVLQTNMGDYDVISTEDWCHVGVRTKDGFEVTCDPRDDYGERTATLTVDMEGLDGLEGVTTPVEISVTQKGSNAVKNPYFTDDDMTGWASVPADMFACDNVKNTAPSDIKAMGGTNVEFIDATRTVEYPCNGTFLYEVTGIPDGTYTFSFQYKRTGTTTGWTFESVFADSDGKESRAPVEVLGSYNEWCLHERQVNVTGGRCSVGIAVSLDEKGGWFNVTDFKLE